MTAPAKTMADTPRGLRLHIGLFGRRNTGKSSLLNALCGQTVSLVSDVAGTTTDPVEKAAELKPLGPVLFVDTAGSDDEGALGALRVARTRAVLERIDAGIVVAPAGDFGAEEEALLAELSRRGVPAIVVLNKADLIASDRGASDAIAFDPIAALPADVRARAAAVVATVAPRGEGIDDLRRALVDALRAAAADPPDLLGDLVPPGRLAVLVVPIDSAAPRGRLILPQVQALRDALDHGAFSLVVRERELAAALATLREPPALVVTDSQAFLKVAAEVPPEVPMTSFSILLARQKGDLGTFARGCLAIETLRPGDRILVAEACTHHPTLEDIGRIKIPRWLEQKVGGPLVFDTVAGQDFPDDLAPYRMVIHCGSCMLTRRAVLARIARCRAAGVPIANYGMTIAYSLGIFARALAPLGGIPQA